MTVAITRTELDAAALRAAAARSKDTAAARRMLALALVMEGVASNPPVALTKTVEVEANRASSNLPSAACARCVPSRTVLDKARAIVESARANMIALQEELDWHCYELYDLIDTTPQYAAPRHYSPWANDHSK
jgi:hypothetical protein